jgi:hypothetical protein
MIDGTVDESDIFEHLKSKLVSEQLSKAPNNSLDTKIPQVNSKHVYPGPHKKLSKIFNFPDEF